MGCGLCRSLAQALPGKRAGTDDEVKPVKAFECSAGALRREEEEYGIRHAAMGSDSRCMQVDSGLEEYRLPSRTLSHDSRTPSLGSKSLEARIYELENLARVQNSTIHKLEQALVTMHNDVGLSVSVMQYNILASYLGKNTMPWFMYGADISQEVRDQLLKKFSERDSTGKHKYQWPAFAEGILSPEEIRAVDYREQFFTWDGRKTKLISEIVGLDADIVSLVELDQYDFFVERIGGVWDSCFHKRPRRASPDGCGMFWRRSKFVLLASQGVDFVDGNDGQGRETRDRSCLMVLLQFATCSKKLVVVSTHLAKDPDSKAQTAIRVRQVSQLIEHLTRFTEDHEATEVPVILLGDLNARDFGEIRGIAKTVWQMKGLPIHKFLWGATDVRTGATSITNARRCRIDCVQYEHNHMEVIEVHPTPSLPHGEVIPNCEHPSDHFPVCVKFRLKDSYQKHKEVARAWLECVAGRERLHPLTDSELRLAFEFFDRGDPACSTIHRRDLEEACLDLQCNLQCDVQQLLLDCFPDNQISSTNFYRAYEGRLNSERIRCIGDLESAFRYFADNCNMISVAELEAAFREITPISFSDVEIKEMISRLNLGSREELVDLSRFCEVVCKASFKTRENTRSDSKTSRCASKDSLCMKLNRLESTILERSSPSGRVVSTILEDSSPPTVSNPFDFGRPNSSPVISSAIDESLFSRPGKPIGRTMLPRIVDIR